MCACGNRQRLCIDGRVEILIGFTMCFVDLFSLDVKARSSVPLAPGIPLVDRLIEFFVSGSAMTQHLLPALRYPVCRVSAQYAVLCVVVMSHPQPSLSGTGVLWVSTGTHRCVDPPRQGGGSTMRQLVRCVDCGCRA